MMRRKIDIVAKDSTVEVELQHFNCKLIKKYKAFLHSVLETFRGAGYTFEDISEGFKSIGILVSPAYIEKHTIGPIDEKIGMVSFFRCGYSVNSICKSFHQPVDYVQSVIEEDEHLRITDYSKWLEKHGIKLAS